MKSQLLLIAVALACAACAREPQSSPAPAAPAGTAAALSTASPGAAPADVTVPDAKPAQVADFRSGDQGRAGRPHHTGAAAVATAPSAAASEPRRITPEELRPLMDAQQAVLVDVRGAGDWAFHRAAEAIHIPYDQLRARSAELPHEALIALYCT